MEKDVIICKCGSNMYKDDTNKEQYTYKCEKCGGKFTFINLRPT